MKINMVPELLCPAGSAESAYAAINNGADAVYLGGKSFNARNSAENVSDDALESLIDYAHQRGVKIHLTLNTLYKNNELKEVLAFARRMYNIGADAFIMQDMGVARLVKEAFPKISLHASTQMTAHSGEDLKLLSAAGFDRAVLARELSIEEITELSKTAAIETETFIHGALCVCYSGQCLMSSVIGGRSGNRGRCAQPCRMAHTLLKNEKPIKKGYLLSPRDINTLEILPQIGAAGVKALKIEGRMKSPEYVGIVTRAYRAHLDMMYQENYQVRPELFDQTLQIFNRGGSSTTGYYFNYAGSDMMSTKTPKSTGTYIGRVVHYEEHSPGPKDSGKGKCTVLAEEPLIPGDGIEIWTSKEPHVGTNISKKINRGERFTVAVTGDIRKGDVVYKSFDKSLADLGKKLAADKSRQMTIQGTVTAKQGVPLTLTLSYDEISKTLQGEVVEAAQNQPMDREKILAQFSKTGGTSYKIDFDNCDIDNGIYVGVSQINSLRRSAIEAFDQAYLAAFKRNAPIVSPEYEQDKEIPVKKVALQIWRKDQMDGALATEADRIYLPLHLGMDRELARWSEACREKGITLFLLLPRITRQRQYGNLIKQIKTLDDKVDGYMACTFGQLDMLKAHTIKPVQLDYSFNVFNNLSRDYYRDHWQGGCTLSPELNFEEMSGLGGGQDEVIVHGRQLMMLTHQCPVGLYEGGKEKGPYCALKGKGQEDNYSLLDRKNQQFPVIRDCGHCIAYILNSQTLLMLDKFHDIKKTSAGIIRLIFWEESSEEIKTVTEAYIAAAGERMADKAALDGVYDRKQITFGHFYRGVE